ncbi:hypothetical protein FJY84_02835 [Candidatus Bathyarchaeota archaeon]|nr:hypothetical protein [Candidatus Bathyarchaeota archaeon]
MERTNRILESLPDYFTVWDTESNIYKFMTALGKQIDEAEKELTLIMRSHWVDKANLEDLDKIGSLFNMPRKNNEQDQEYRSRLKRAIIEYQGGGTKNAILTTVNQELGLPQNSLIELIENPPKEVIKEHIVNSGDIWEMSSESIFDTEPIIELSIHSEHDKIENPSITNLETNEVITYNGIIKKGQTIKLEKGTKKKNDEKNPPKVLRKKHLWSYKEPISKEIGVFDSSVFDESKFAVGIPTIKIGFKWVANTPATFELRIPEKVIPLGKEFKSIQDTVYAIKASGVTAIINLVKE